MPKKKAANTSKTAHVMNLISKNSAAPVPPAEGSPEPEQQAAPVVPPPPAVLPSLNADMEITSQIKSALEDLLEDDAPAAEAADILDETPVDGQANSLDVSQAVSLEEGALDAEDADPEPNPQAEEEAPTPAAAEPEAEPVEAEEPLAAEEPAIVEASPTAPKEPDIEEAPAAVETPISEPAAQISLDEIVCVNIIQTLVEESVDKYIHMFGLCHCTRCVADVKAIALNNLVPKYVVAPEKERSFWVTIYHERYHAEVTAQILHACKRVMDNPLHDK